MSESTFKKRLVEMQKELKAPKNLYNSFGKYKYRNAEGILEAAKPLLDKYNLLLVVADDIVQIGERYYVKAIATVSDAMGPECVVASAFAREAEEKKGQDESQITGTASSYARKYALNGLFLLDDTKDADTDEYHNQTQGKQSEADKAEAFDKNCDEIGNMKIAPIKVNIIKQKCVEYGITEKTVLAKYDLKILEDMTESQFSDAVLTFERTKKQ